MGLGILDDHNLDHVPGTAVVLEGEQRREVERKAVEGGLRYDKTGQVLLVPQPSDDPNDPLNWPLWKRDMIICILSLAAVIASTLSSILAANSVQLALYFGHNFTDIALLTGYHLLGVGVAGFLFVPSAVIWGKRHVYLLGTVIIVISCAWGGGSGRNYASFLWARVFQGVGLAPYEALVNASVGDLYHVHQRGARMAVSNFFVFGGAFFTPVLAGKIAHEMGHQWPLNFVAIFAGCMLPLIFFLCPETAYKREEKFDIDTMGNLVTKNGLELASVTKQNGHSSDSKSTSDETARDSNSPLNADHRPANPDRPVPRKATFVESLALFTGRKSDQHYIHLLLRPFSLFLHPGILWACLIQGVLIGFTVLIGVVLASILLGPPLWFGEVKTGYMYSGAFIGAVLGFALMGLVADPSARLLTRWNRGVYEPEFRIILVIPQLILGGAGLYGFGWTSGDTATYGWFWPDFFFALVVMGMVCGATASALYIVDAHRDMSIEAFTCLLVFKNFFSFALTFKGFDWIIAAGKKAGGDGVKDVFIIVGSVQVAICALSIPMYILGKKNRSFFHRHNIFFKSTDAVADVVTFQKMRSGKKPGVVVG